MAHLAEERPDDRNAAKDWDLLDCDFYLVLQKASDDEGLAVLEHNGRLGSLAPQPRDPKPPGLQRGDFVNLADLRRHLEPDSPVGKNRWGEVQPHAERLKFDVNLILCDHSEGELPAGEEGGCLAAYGDECRLGKGLGEALAF